MNNPIRAAVQRHVEASKLLRMGGAMDGGAALELGCGCGVGAELILQRFGAARVDGFDLDPRMVRRARRRMRTAAPHASGSGTRRPSQHPTTSTTRFSTSVSSTTFRIGGRQLRRCSGCSRQAAASMRRRSWRRPFGAAAISSRTRKRTGLTRSSSRRRSWKPVSRPSRSRTWAGRSPGSWPRNRLQLRSAGQSVPWRKARVVALTRERVPGHVPDLRGARSSGVDR